MAVSRSLGRLTVDLIAKVGGFTRGMTEAERSADNAARRIEARKRKMARKLSNIYAGIAKAAVAAFVAINTVIVAGVAKSIQSIDDVGNAAQRAGVEVEKFSALVYAGRFGDASMDDLQRAFGRLSRSMVDFQNGNQKTVAAFNELKVSAVDAEGKLRAPEEVLLDIADAFRANEGKSETLAAGFAILGRRVENILPFLNMGSKGITDLMDEAERLGYVFDRETVERAAKFNDAIERIKTSSGGLFLQMTEKLLPTLEDVSEELAENAIEFVESGKAADAAEVAIDFLKGSVGLMSVAFHAANVAVKAFKATLIQLGAPVRNFYTQASGVVNQAWTFTESLLRGEGLSEAAAQVTRIGNQMRSDMQGIAATADEAWADVFASLGARDPEKEAQERERREREREERRKRRDEAWEERKRRQREIAEAIARANEAAGEGADQADDIAQRAIENLKRQIGMQNLKTEAERTEYELREGHWKNATPEQAKELRRLAQLIDAHNEAGKAGSNAGDATAEAAKRAKEALKQQQLAMQELYESTVDGLTRQIALLGVTTEYERNLYEVQAGRYAMLDRHQQDHILQLSQQLDHDRAILDEQKKQEEARKQAERAEQDRLDRIQDYLDNLQMESSLLGHTREIQEQMLVLNQLKLDAESELGMVVLDNIRAYQAQAEAMETQIGLMDEMRNSMSSALVDWTSGTKSFKDAFMDAINQIHRRILQMIADNAVQQLFGGFGSAQTGRAGGWMSQFFGLFTSAGGRATGGPVAAGGLYRVNELGPEVLTVRGSDYLMMGSDVGYVTPHHKVASRSVTQQNSFIIQGRIDRRTQEQIAMTVGRQASIAARRNT